MKRGFIYVATGASYIAEAVQSARSLLKAMPSASCTLLTEAQHGLSDGHPFQDIILIGEPQYRPIDKVLALEQSPYDETVFLDSDTHVAGDLSGLFDLLKTFDLAAAQETLRGWHYQLPGIPEAFPEFNTGVLVFRRSAELTCFIEQWRLHFEHLKQSHGFVTDQPAFRYALFFSKLRIAALPSEYHFITWTPNYVMWEAKLLHGRGKLPLIAQTLNRHLSARAYVPDLGPIRPFMGRLVWARQLVALLPRLLHLLIARPRMNPVADHWTKEEAQLSKQRRS